MSEEKKLKRQRYREKLSYIYHEYILPFIMISTIVFTEFFIFINFFI
jgi:hypothetical protein